MQNAAHSLEHLLALCVQQDASDLHLSAGLPPYLRVHGLLEPIPGQPALAAADTEAIARVLLAQTDPRPLETTGSVDGAVTAAGARFRFNVFRRQGEISIALRRLEDRFRTLVELGLPDSLYALCDLPDGLVIVAGPTGAGKSTTLATLIDRINHSRRCHLITIEDPVEYIHQSHLALVNQRQIGRDAANFNDALVASLRQDPDVILVGEIREINTIRTAITAAETGHLVFTTVHAPDAAGVIERLVSVFPADEQAGVRRQLALTLRTVVSQHLLVADGPAAQRPAGPGLPPRSRVVVSEVLFVNTAVANLIATAKTAQIYSSMETGSAQGMQTIEQDLARLLLEGWISERTAMTMARHPQLLQDRVARSRGGRPGFPPRPGSKP